MNPSSSSSAKIDSSFPSANQGERSLTRRKWLKFLTGAVVSVGGAAAYARFIEPNWLDLTEKSLADTGIAKLKGLRILHLSDLHASRQVSVEQIESAFQLGLDQKPHLACFTGDYLTNRHFDPELYARAFARVSAQIPCFAVMGNHDQRMSHSFSVMMRSIFEKANITLLHNRSVVIPNPSGSDGSLQIVGVGDTWSRECDPRKAFQGTQAEIPTLLLSHNPDSKSLMKPYAWDLMLSGHTHGGQIRLPIIGGRLFAPVHDKNYIEGLLPWENRYLHITRGIGNLHGLRINCRPEVSLLTCPS